jgi:K+ transporter
MPFVSLPAPTSGHLGAGIAVIFDMVLTTHFMTLLMITVWRKHLIYPVMFYTIFAAIELTYVSSAVRKVRTLCPHTTCDLLEAMSSLLALVHTRLFI